MNGNHIRVKGQQGERELASLLREHLGVKIRRNWERQSAEGGVDLIDDSGPDSPLAGWAIECKRAKEWDNRWWLQALEQAVRRNDAPVLCYRIDGQGRGLPPLEKWRCRVLLRDITDIDVSPNYTADITLAAWIEIARELHSASLIAVAGAEVNPSQDEWTWWQEELREAHANGRRDYEREVFGQPYPESDAPDDQDLNEAYKAGWQERRREVERPPERQPTGKEIC